MNETLKATIAAVVVVVVNVGLYVFGVQIDGELLATILTALAIAVTTAITAWNNFNFTKAAQAGQKLTDDIKAGRVISEFVKEE